MRIRGTVVLAAFAMLVGHASANTQTVIGKSLVVKNPQPTGDPALRKVTVIAKEHGSTGTTVGDPTTSGATIEVIANGTASSRQIFTLPPGLAPNAGSGWRVIGTNPVIGYVYKDTAGTISPVKTVTFKKTGAPTNIFLIKVVIQGNLGPDPQPRVTVVPPNLGTDGGMIFSVGDGDSYCTTFGGTAGGLVTNNFDRVFKIVSNADHPTTADGCPTLRP